MVLRKRRPRGPFNNRDIDIGQKVLLTAICCLKLLVNRMLVEVGQDITYICTGNLCISAPLSRTSPLCSSRLSIYFKFSPALVWSRVA